jgi:8-oxo-dGTP pyrophosphatase MutT (NUDIX family)
VELQLIDKLALLYLKNGKILCTMSKGKDTWYLPGGKRETGENDEQALRREVREELNVELVDGTITYYGTFSAQAHGKPEGTLVQMTCYTAELSGEPVASSEIERIEFHGYHDDITKSPVDYLIFEDLFEKSLLQ